MTKQQAEKDMKFYSVDPEFARIRWQLHENDIQARIDSMIENTIFVERYR